MPDVWSIETRANTPISQLDTAGAVDGDVVTFNGVQAIWAAPSGTSTVKMVHVVISGDYSAAINDFLEVSLDADAVITLPPLAGCQEGDRVAVWLKLANGHILTIDGDGGDTVDEFTEDTMSVRNQVRVYEVGDGLSSWIIT